jgi:hypothetical protein
MTETKSLQPFSGIPPGRILVAEVVYTVLKPHFIDVVIDEMMTEKQASLAIDIWGGL